MSEVKTVRLQLNDDFGALGGKGDVLVLPVSPNGVIRAHPDARFWRRRVKDAKTNKCVEILKKGDIGSRAKAELETLHAAILGDAELRAEAKKTKATPGADQGVNTNGE